MKYLLIIGRVLFSIPLAFAGYNHLSMGSKMASYVPSFIPGSGTFWIYFTGISMILASISIITTKYAKWASILLAVELFVFIFTIQIPGLFNPQTMQMSMVGLINNTAMAGAALFFGGYFAEKGK